MRRARQGAMLLPDGTVLVASGFQGGATAEVYDPATGQWSSAGEMHHEHGSSGSLSNSQPAVVLSSNPRSFEARPQACAPHCGKVLVAGNNPTGAVELYTPTCPTTWPRPPQQLSCDGDRRPAPGKPAGTPGRGPQPQAIGGAATAP